MVKRKVFLKSDISTPRVEHTRSPSGAVVILTEEIPPAITLVKFGIHGKRTNSFDFAYWYGSGIDQIVYACQKQIERFLEGQDAEVTQSTVLTYCGSGLRSFFSFLTTLSVSTKRELTLESIDRSIIDGYLSYLRIAGIVTSTQKSQFSATKSVLKALAYRGLIRQVQTGDSATFPSNPFPGVHRKVKGERPLPLQERKAFSKAVKAAVMPIFSEDVIPTTELLSYALLVIALHTGRNTTPLLEMTWDCLRSHPKDNTLFLVLYKRRGHSSSKAPIKADRRRDIHIESMPTIRPTVAALINRVIELSARLRSEASDSIKDRVWLYRMRAPARGGTIGEVRALTEDTLGRSVKLLIKQYNLINSDGKPMRINVSRLRKTFVNRIYEILDGDVVATSVAAGNTVQVTSLNYLRPGEDAQKNWKFMGIALVNELTTSTVGATERTPVGQCSDTRNGEYAPKRDGAVCMSFFNCLRCQNYVVTGDDLYKVFSFYWRILRERARMTPKRWQRHFSHIVRLIERDIAEAGVAQGVFKQAHVDLERERARHDPHPFWHSGTIVEHIGGEMQ
jgi:hypothetical protein